MTSTTGPGNLHLLYDSNHSDSTLKCQGREFNVHRAILGHASDYFKRMYSGPWKENSEGVVDLDSLEPAVLEQALRCLYAGTLDVVQAPYQEDLLFNIRLYQFGDSHLADPMRIQAYQKCKELFEHFKPKLRDIASLELVEEAVVLVLSITRHNDTDLRLLLLRVCAQTVWRLGYRLKDWAECSGDSRWDLIAPSALSCSKISTGDVAGTNVSSTEESPSKAPPSKEKPPNPTRLQKKKLRAKELLGDIIAKIEQEDVIAWRALIQEAHRIEEQKDRLVEQDNEITDLRPAKERAEFSSRLLRSHTICRRGGCGAKLLVEGCEFGPDGILKALRCSRCNCRHTQLKNGV